MGKYKAINISRAGTLPHVPETIKFDDGIVIDESQAVPHPITGEPQPLEVYRGKMTDCIKWVERNEAPRMSEAFAYNLIIQDVQESIKCQDSQEQADNLAEALRILEAHLEEYFVGKGQKNGIRQKLLP